MSSLLRCVETADSGGQDDGVPWWMKYAGKAAGILGGLGRSTYTQKKMTLLNFHSDPLLVFSLTSST
jgi:hypothetical protein